MPCDRAFRIAGRESFRPSVRNWIGLVPGLAQQALLRTEGHISS